MPGGIVHLKRGGHQIRAETIMLNDGIDHVIYLLAPGLAFGSWRPDGGHQLISNFDLGVDKLWFVAASPADTRNSATLKTHRFDGTVTYETFDSDADQDPLTTDHDAVWAVSISAAPHQLLRLVLHKFTIEFDQLDDQRAAFQIISNQPATGVMPFDTVANLFRDSLGYIDDWHDITTSSLLPDAASLPSIV
jgi:adenosyl cobinamide kinase/adenosyl cobinamide phosphate guanylyltransferase